MTPTPCPTSIVDQIAGLEKLKDNWYSMGEGTAYSDFELSLYKGYLLGLSFGWSIPTPYIYPVPSGGIRAEWDVASTGVVLELNPKEIRLFFGETETVLPLTLADMGSMGATLAALLNTEVK